MKVNVQFFSRLRELAGTSDFELEVPEKITVSALLRILYARVPELQEWDKSILVAADLEFVNREYVLQSNDRISIMPPVQGG